MGKILGIDLGTTNSAMAVVNDYGRPEILINADGGRITPSVVQFEGIDAVVGQTAKLDAISRPLDTVQYVKRHMGDRDWSFRSEVGNAYSPEDISAIILRRLKEDAEQRLGETITQAVISVPAYFGDAGRMATADAARIAGLEAVRVLNEPTAAALAYGVGSAYTGTVLIFDLGGGTFDVTIMRVGNGDFEVLATDGDKHLGGFDWDNAVMEWLNARFMANGGPDLLAEAESEQHLRDQAERAKHTLSTREETSVRLRMHGFSEKLTLTRTFFDELTAPLLNRTALLVDKAMADVGIAWSAIDKVLLVGGSTRMKQVTELVESLSGERPSLEVNPDEIVALGAALQGALLGNEGTNALPVPIVDAAGRRVPAVRVLDVTSHSLGLVVMDEYGRPSNQVMLTKGSRVPCALSDVFGTVSDYQTGWECEITEGEDIDLTYVSIVGRGQVVLPGRHRAGAPHEIMLTYDENQMFHVYVKDLTDNRVIGELHLDRAANLGQGDIDASRRNLEAADVS
jgi:molecular chaperone DnaK